jgi:predicted amidophosphoribosyltransferase
MSDITHAAVCSDCGEDTYAWERYCYECGADRWGESDA